MSSLIDLVNKFGGPSAKEELSRLINKADSQGLTGGLFFENWTSLATATTKVEVEGNSKSDYKGYLLQIERSFNLDPLSNPIVIRTDDQIRRGEGPIQNGIELNREEWRGRGQIHIWHLDGEFFPNEKLFVRQNEIWGDCGASSVAAYALCSLPQLLYYVFSEWFGSGVETTVLTELIYKSISSSGLRALLSILPAPINLRDGINRVKTPATLGRPVSVKGFEELLDKVVRSILEGFGCYSINFPRPDDYKDYSQLAAYRMAAKHIVEQLPERL